VSGRTRVVFDEWQPATDYTNAVSQIYNNSFIMGEILDSFSFKEYTLTQYQRRTKEYFNAMKNTVDV
jgi:hypothetical protein